jgi:two-component system NtrC family response regulator
MRLQQDSPAKILVIEDDPDYAEMLQRQFEEMEHEPTVAHRLKDGIKAAETMSPDVIFLDVGLPDGSGLMAISSLKELPGHPEVIIVTGRGSADGAELAIRSGAWDYVPKGGSFQEIALALARALSYRKQKQVTSAVPQWGPA